MAGVDRACLDQVRGGLQDESLGRVLHQLAQRVAYGLGLRIVCHASSVARGARLGQRVARETRKRSRGRIVVVPATESRAWLKGPTLPPGPRCSGPGMTVSEGSSVGGSRHE